MRIRLDPERGKIAGHDLVEVAIALGEVETVAEDELVIDGEAEEPDRSGHDATGGLVQQSAHFERARTPTLELAENVGEREAGVDDVLDEHNVAAGDVGVQVFHDAHP